MSKFIQLYEELFKPQSPEDIERIDKEKPELLKKEWIEEFLSRKDIHKNPDGSYDVDGDVTMAEMPFIDIPLKFNKVGGDFSCRDCINLTSLQGSPESVGGEFSCSYCIKLVTLEGAPKTVERLFGCHGCNRLTSLEGGPDRVGTHFDVSCCLNLASLRGAPKQIGQIFSCYNCISLTSLEGGPEHVGSHFSCKDCESLTSLEGAPKSVGEDFYCNDKFTEEEVRAVCDVKGRVIL